MYLSCIPFALINEYLLIEGGRRGGGGGGKTATINTYNPAKKMNKVITEPRIR